MHHGQCAHHKTGGAKAALQSVMLAKALLHHMQFIRVGCHTLNRHHSLIGALQRQPVARFDGFAIDQHGAGPALCRVTPLVSSGELALVA